MPTDPSVVDPSPSVVDPGASLIDLGLIDLGGGRPDELSGLDQPRPPGRASARLLRWWPMVVLSVVLAGSTGAAAPVPPGLSLTFTIPTEQRTTVALTERRLYVATGSPASVQVEDPLWRLSAYRLSDGTPEWTVPHDAPTRPGTVQVTVLDGVPLTTGWRTYTEQSSLASIHADAHTTAYEPGTGEPLWTRSGFIAAYRDGQVVLDLVEYAGTPPAPVRYTVTGVTLATGEVRWAHQLAVGSGAGPDSAGQGLPHADVWDLSEDGRHLATLRHDGRLTVRDLAAGTEVVHDLARSWHDASLLVTDGLVRVSTLKDRQRTLAVYDLHPLRERWTLTEQSSTASLSPCGQVLCLQSRYGLAGLDPSTGAQRWGVVESWLRPTLLELPWPEGHLQVGHRSETAPVAGVADLTEVVLVDAATGQEALRLGGWRSYAAGRDHHPYPTVELRETGAHRPGHPDYDPGRLWLGRVDPGLRRVDVLGSLDQVRDCELGRRHVACVSTRQRVEVWRIG